MNVIKSYIVTNAASSGGVVGDQNLSEVLTEGNDGGGLQIKNIADPTDEQDASTQGYVDAVAENLQGYVDAVAENLQDQIDNISAVRSVIVFTGTASTITGVTGNQIIKSFLIPANTFVTGDLLFFDVRFSRPPAAQATQTATRILMNTTNNLAGSPVSLTASVNMNNTGKYSLLLRSMPITASNKIKGVSTSNAAVTDLVSTTTDYDEKTVDLTVDQYFIVLVEPLTAGDSITCEAVIVERLRP